MEYLMDHTLRNIIMPTYCCLIHNNPSNFVQVFAESSPQPVLEFI